jgi:cell wall-associated NlpC family hydrolase
MKKTSFVILTILSALCFFGCVSGGNGVGADTSVAETPSENISDGAAPTESGDEITDGGSGETAVSVDTDAVSQLICIRSKTDGLNVRAGKSALYASFGTLDEGDVAYYVGESDGWYETYYRGGKAYVSSKYAEKITFDTASEEIESVIEVGMRYLGTPYVYGAVRLHDGYGVFCEGFTDTEFDCSSFMQYIFYYGAGELLQVNTRTQVFQGEETSKEDLRRGDLMFFTNSSRYYNTGLERIGHVGMYLGNGYIMQTASDHAVIEKISETRWNYFICARRIIE